MDRLKAPGIACLIGTICLILNMLALQSVPPVDSFLVGGYTISAIWLIITLFQEEE